MKIHRVCPSGISTPFFKSEIWIKLQHSKNKHINMHKMYHMMVIITLNHEICMVILNKERCCGQNASKIPVLKRVSGANKTYSHPNGC